MEPVASLDNRCMKREDQELLEFLLKMRSENPDHLLPMTAVPPGEGFVRQFTTKLSNTSDA